MIYSPQDREHFPRATFSSLKLNGVTHTTNNKLNVSFTVELEFYYNEFDWGVIYRQIGLAGGRADNMFYKVGGSRS